MATHEQLERVVGLAADKARAGLARRPDGFPFVTEGGRWVEVDDGGWTGGFWVGTLWRLWAVTGEGGFRAGAERLMERLQGRIERGRAVFGGEPDFDLGFLFFHSFVLGARLTGDGGMRDVALRAADTLAGLAGARTGLLMHDYPGKGPGSIIDALMNLELLWWSGRHGGPGRTEHTRIARRHLARTLELMVRGDGSTIACVLLDPATGEARGPATHHGLAPGSCWSRGLAWGIHGCLSAWRAVGDRSAAAATGELLRRWDAGVGQDGVPPWDLDDPDPAAPRDSSAAAIVAAALPGRPLDGLLGRVRWSTDADGLLGDGTYSVPYGRGVGAATVWGDYFFLAAALDRLALAASFLR